MVCPWPTTGLHASISNPLELWRHCRAGSRRRARCCRWTTAACEVLRSHKTCMGRRA
jgi:hypothetical protein